MSRCLSKYDESIKRGYCRTATARAPSPRPDGGPSVPVVQVTTDRLLFYTGYNFICLCVLDDDQPPASVGSIGFYFLPPSAWPLFFTPREGRTGVVQEVLLLSARVCYFFYSFLLFVFLSFVFFSELAFCFVGSVIVCSRFARALLSGAGGGKCSRRVLICCSLPFTFFRFLFFNFLVLPFEKFCSSLCFESVAEKRTRQRERQREEEEAAIKFPCFDWGSVRRRSSDALKTCQPVRARVETSRSDPMDGRRGVVAEKKETGC